MPADRYHHGHLREALLEAALEVIDADGVEKLSVRAIARRAGVSSGAPFRHFADKGALVAAAAESALRHFVDVTAAAVEAEKEPAARMRALGVAFVRFAHDHPTRFRVIFRDDVVRLPEVAALREQLRGRLLELVVEGQASGVIRGGPPEPIMLAAYASVYGLARLYTDGLIAELGDSLPPPELLATAALDLLGEGLAPR